MEEEGVGVASKVLAELKQCTDESLNTCSNSGPFCDTEVTEAVIKSFSSGSRTCRDLAPDILQKIPNSSGARNITKVMKGSSNDRTDIFSNKALFVAVLLGGLVAGYLIRHVMEWFKAEPRSAPNITHHHHDHHHYHHKIETGGQASDPMGSVASVPRMPPTFGDFASTSRSPSPKRPRPANPFIHRDRERRPGAPPGLPPDPWIAK